MSLEPTPARLPEKGDDDVLYVIDISSFIFRAYHALPPLSNSRGEPTHAVKGVTQMLKKLVDERAPRRVVVAMDSKQPSFRKDLFDGYKANRPPPPPDLSQQIERVRQLVTAWGMNPHGLAGVEADDIIATCVKRANEAGLRTVIVSADKDLLQLVNGGVVMYDTMRDKVFGRAETVEKMGVPPEQVRDLLALMGDSSDNIPGVPSVGAKTAAKYLASYGSLDGLYENLDKIKGKTGEKLAEHRDQAYLSRELVSLRDDVELPFDPAECVYEGGDVPELRRIFAELEFTALLASLDTGERDVEAHYAAVRDEAELVRVLNAVRERAALGLHCLVDGGNPHRERAVGIGLSMGAAVGHYVPFTETTLAHLRPVLENSLIRKISDDLKRDELALRREGIKLRGHAFDTMLSSYVIDPGRHGHGIEEVARAELGAELPTEEGVLGRGAKRRRVSEATEAEATTLACSRADYAQRIAETVGDRMTKKPYDALYFGLELPLTHVLAEIEATGMRVDVSMLEAMSTKVEADLARLEKRCHELAGRPFNVGSPRQLEAVLFDELGLPVQKKTKTGRSTDQTVLEDLSLLHDLPATILELRSLSKLKSTYLDLLPREVNPSTGRIHTCFNQAVAATGRLSSSDPNLQNIPIRTEIGRKIRDAFIPRDGFVMVSADYSQIELRILAHLSRDAALLAAYAEHRDVHAQTAAALFGVPESQVDREMRGRGKTVNFAVIYGQTEFALARNLRIDRAEARRYIDAFFERYEGVARYMDEAVRSARETGYATTLMERRRSVADIRSENRNLRMAAERVARNTPIQGTAADIIKRAMIEVFEAMRRAKMESRMLLTVHDELVFEAPESELAELEAMAQREMQNAARLDVPLVVEVGHGPSWGAAH
jgi:DNA polymerase I